VLLDTNEELDKYALSSSTYGEAIAFAISIKQKTDKINSVKIKPFRNVPLVRKDLKENNDFKMQKSVVTIRYFYNNQIL
jgi:hypothetical protein